MANLRRNAIAEARAALLLLDGKATRALAAGEPAPGAQSCVDIR